MNARDQALVTGKQQCQARRFVNTPALGFNDAVFNLVAHAQTVASANAIGFQNQGHQVVVHHAVQSDRTAFFKTHGDFLAFDLDVVFPKRHAHDGIDNFHARVQKLKVFRFVRGTQHIGVGGVGLLSRHLVTKTVCRHEGRHFSAATQLINELLVQPWFVDFQ